MVRMSVFSCWALDADGPSDGVCVGGDRCDACAAGDGARRCGLARVFRVGCVQWCVVAAVVGALAPAATRRARVSAARRRGSARAGVGRACGGHAAGIRGGQARDAQGGAASPVCLSDVSLTEDPPRARGRVRRPACCRRLATRHPRRPRAGRRCPPRSSRPRTRLDRRPCGG